MNAVDSPHNEEMRDLYRELILDHARNPRHFGSLDDATHTAEGINPLCGDKLRLFVRVDDHQAIDAARFEGSGCAISVASASLMTDMIIGLTVQQALDCFSAVSQRLSTPDSVPEPDLDVNLDKIKALDGVRDYPSRVKCATLAWHALNAAMQKISTPTSTE